MQAQESSRGSASHHAVATNDAHADESGIWDFIPHPFDEPTTRDPSVHDRTNRLAFLFFVVTSIIFTALFASDVGHLLCPVQTYGTACLTRPQFGADTSSDSQWCNQLVATSCTATDDNPDSYYKSSKFTASCTSQCVAASCGSCYSNCAGMTAETGLAPLSGISPVTSTGYGVATVSSAKSCSAFSSFLKTYRVLGSASDGQCSPACSTWSNSFYTANQECLPSGPLPGWTISAGQGFNKSATAMIKCCGTIANVAICPSAASTIGILAGYLSLWFSTVQFCFAFLLKKLRTSAASPSSVRALEMSTVDVGAK